MEQIPQETWMTMGQLKAELGLCNQTIVDAIRLGDLPAKKRLVGPELRPGKKARNMSHYKLEDVRHYLPDGPMYRIKGRKGALADGASPRNPQCMTTDEVARYLSVTRSTIHKYAKNGTIPCQKFGRAIIRFDINEVKAALFTRPPQPGGAA